MDYNEISKLEDFLRNEEEVDVAPEVASLRFDYIKSIKDCFKYLRENWMYGNALLLAMYYGDKSNRIADALIFIEENFPAYCGVMKYDYSNKAKINFTWSVLLEKSDRHYEAVEKNRKGVLMQFVDNTTYDNWEFFSFRACTKYVLSEIADEEISLMHPDEFNDPMDTVLLNWLKNQKEIADSNLSKIIAENNLEALSNLRIRCFSRTERLPYHETGEEAEKLRKHKRQDILKISPLMWAHYADNHKGICIKYAFTSNMFKLLNDEETEITRFGNLNYKKSLNINDDEITISDALFAKSKVWGYEHETKLFFL